MEQNQLFFLAQRAQHSLSKLGDKVFQQEVGVSAAHLAALFYLIRNNNCLLKDLSAGLDLNNSAVTGLVRRMEAAGLVVKSACDNDGRAFRVTITEKGLAATNSADPVVEKISHLLTSDFSETEMNTVLRFFATIVAVKEVEQGAFLGSF